MKTIHIIENANELLELIGNRDAPHVENHPPLLVLPKDAILVFSEEGVKLQGCNFELFHGITKDEVMKVIFERVGVKLHLT